MIKKKLFVISTVLILGLSVLSGCTSDPYRQGQGPTGGEMAADALIVRPMTLAYSAVGLAAWVVTLPFTIPNGGFADAGREWVVEPFAYSFDRPLGEIGEKR